MISWSELISCIEKLEELPNGNGSEIEFRYRGIEYGIVSYRGSCDIGRCPDMTFDGNALTHSEETLYRYSSLNELGKAKDIGFSVEECWDLFEDICIKPDFNEFGFEEIYASYEKANSKNKKWVLHGKMGN